jgi:hypothetical protein
VDGEVSKLAWKLFVQNCVTILDDLANCRITIPQAYDRIESMKNLVSDVSIIEDICNVISEIEGFPSSYKGLQECLKKGPTEVELIHYLSS